MENVKETNQEKELDVNAVAEEIIKPTQPQEEQNQQQQHQEKENQLQQHQEEQQHQPEELQKHQDVIEEEVAIKEIATPGENQLHQQPPQQEQEPKQLQQQQPEAEVINYEEDDEDDDDDEEKETSQKLVIDIPDDEEEEEEREDDDDDVIALDDLPHEETALTESDKVCSKSKEVVAIITLSDGEEDTPITEIALKPGKIQKRRSMGSVAATSGIEEEHYRLKRRKINVAGAPKMPLTGYVRYMNDRRDTLRKEHPTKTAMEHTKIIGEEWHSLPADVKSSYLKAADADKQRYVKELHIFLKARPDILASELAKNKIRKTAESNNSPNPITTTATATTTASTAAKSSVLKEKPTTVNESTLKIAKDNNVKENISKELSAKRKRTPTPTNSTPSTSQQVAVPQQAAKRKSTPTPPASTSAGNTNATNTRNASTSHTAASSSSNIASTATTTGNTISIVTPTPGEIPIFTNEFLEHNKIYDMELRSLRKSKTDLEQQNSVLEKHVENMKFGVEKMITENNELEEKNKLLELYLAKLRRKLVIAFSALPLPSAPNGATVDNIDGYMQDLYKMSTSNSHGPATLNKAKDIIRKLDLQIQL